MGNLTFAVAGGGPANKDSINDLLNDWLGFGEKDADGYYTGENLKFGDIRLILPLTDEHFSPGVAMVHQWSALANLEFTGVISSTTPPARRDVKGAKGETDDLVPASDVYEKIIELLGEADPQDEVALLVLHEDTDPDEATRALIEGAFALDVPVLNLSYGLAPLDPPQQNEPEPQAEQAEQAEPVDGRAPAPSGFGQQLRDAVRRGEDGPVVITNTITRQTEVNLGGETDGGDPVGYVFSTLDTVVEFLAAADTLARMLGTGMSDGPGGALTDRVLRSIVILQRLAPAAEPPVRMFGPLGANGPVRDEVPQGPVTLPQELAGRVPQPQMPPQPQPQPQQVAPKPRATRTVTEWYDEAAGQWRPKGRGRPRKDVQTRQVEVEVED